MDHLQVFLFGVVATASAAVGAFFYRFWRRTRDPLFVAFAVAFLLMAANWTAQAFVSGDETYYAAIYLLRLAAFGVIILGVIGKNRRAHRAHAMADLSDRSTISASSRSPVVLAGARFHGASSGADAPRTRRSAGDRSDDA